MLRQNTVIFLPNLSQGSVCADSWSLRNFAALPGKQTFSPRPTSRLSLETPGWEMLHYEGNAMSPVEVE